MRCDAGRSRRTGNVLVLCAVSMIALLAMASLAIDISKMVSERHIYQQFADSASLMGAIGLANTRTDPGNPYLSVRNASEMIWQYLHQYPVNGEYLSRGQVSIHVGRAEQDESGRYHFVGSAGYAPAYFNAVRVGLKSSEIPTVLGSVVGLSDYTIEVSASSMMMPRVISLGVDVSPSMSEDSWIGEGKLRLLSNRGVEPNLFGVWAGLPNEPGDPGYTPTRDGPCFGSFMKQRGYGFAGVDPDEHLNDLYNAALDPGLIHLEPGHSDTEIENLLIAQGYNATEVAELMSAIDGGAGGNEYFSPHYWASFPDELHRGWFYTATCALGINWWHSGLTEPDENERDPKWMSMGPGGTPYTGSPAWNNGSIEGPVRPFQDSGGELVPLVAYPYGDPSDFENTWFNYMLQISYSDMYPDHNLQYRYGVKTFVDYLLRERPSSEDTPCLHRVPAQPLEAVKSTAEILVEGLIERDNQDMLALESFSHDAHHEIDMVDLGNSALVLDRLRRLQAGHYEDGTNIQASIRESMLTLTSRPMYDGTVIHSNREKRMIVLTDGLANRYLETDSAGNTTVGIDINSAEHHPTARTRALAEARLAAAIGIRIDTITMGIGASDTGTAGAQAAWQLMEDIADVGSGSHYHVEGTPEQIEQQLENVFDDIGGSGVAVLIE